MINIMIDEAAAFDMLSILQLKTHKNDTSFNSYKMFLDDLYCELGQEVVSIILASVEYADLFKANQEVFSLIDEVVNEPIETIKAKYVHNANMKRFYAKKALQEKFFNTELTEQKTVE
jgi:hypothetical protein